MDPSHRNTLDGLPHRRQRLLLDCVRTRDEADGFSFTTTPPDRTPKRICDFAPDVVLGIFNNRMTHGYANQCIAATTLRGYGAYVRLLYNCGLVADHVSAAAFIDRHGNDLSKGQVKAMKSAVNHAHRVLGAVVDLDAERRLEAVVRGHRASVNDGIKSGTHVPGRCAGGLSWAQVDLVAARIRARTSRDESSLDFATVVQWGGAWRVAELDHLRVGQFVVTYDQQKRPISIRHTWYREKASVAGKLTQVSRELYPFPDFLALIDRRLVRLRARLGETGTFFPPGTSDRLKDLLNRIILPQMMAAGVLDSRLRWSSHSNRIGSAQQAAEAAGAVVAARLAAVQLRTGHASAQWAEFYSRSNQIRIESQTHPAPAGDADDEDLESEADSDASAASLDVDDHDDDLSDASSDTSGDEDSDNESSAPGRASTASAAPAARSRRMEEHARRVAEVAALQLGPCYSSRPRRVRPFGKLR